MIKPIFYAILLLGVVVFLDWIYDQETGDFRRTNIVFDLDYQPMLDVPAPTSSEQAWLKQFMQQKTFTWLGHGHQVYAFSSPDQKYVLKIFKFKRFKPTWVDAIPFVDVKKREQWRKNRLDILFSGFYVAYTYDRDHTGLHYLQLKPVRNLNAQVTVIDRLGFSHQVNLGEVLFAVQERAVRTKDLFVELLAAGKVEEVKQHISSLMKMFVREYKRGVLDRDHNVLINTGFVQGRPLRIDVGKLTYSEEIKKPEVFKIDLSKILRNRLYLWFNKHYPQYAEELDAHMKTQPLEGSNQGLNK